MSQRGSQAIERGVVGSASLDHIETRALKVPDQGGVVHMGPVAQHLPMIGAVPPTTPHQTIGNVPTTGYQSMVDLTVSIPLALSRAGLSHKQACAYMGLDPSNWTKALHGNGTHVSLQRLLCLPAAFWAEFLPLIAQPFGLEVSCEDRRATALRQTAIALSALANTLGGMAR